RIECREPGWVVFGGGGSDRAGAFHFVDVAAVGGGVFEVGAGLGSYAACLRRWCLAHPFFLEALIQMWAALGTGRSGCATWPRSWHVTTSAFFYETFLMGCSYIWP